MGDTVHAPYGLLNAWKNHSNIVVSGLCGAPGVPVSIRRFAITSGANEPGMLIGRMIGNQVNDYPNVPPTCVAYETIKVLYCAQPPIDPIEIRYVIPVVLVWCWL